MLKIIYFFALLHDSLSFWITRENIKAIQSKIVDTSIYEVYLSLSPSQETDLFKKNPTSLKPETELKVSVSVFYANKELNVAWVTSKKLLGWSDYEYIPEYPRSAILSFLTTITVEELNHYFVEKDKLNKIKYPFLIKEFLDVLLSRQMHSVTMQPVPVLGSIRVSKFDYQENCLVGLVYVYNGYKTEQGSKLFCGNWLGEDEKIKVKIGKVNANNLRNNLRPVEGLNELWVKGFYEDVKKLYDDPDSGDEVKASRIEKHKDNGDKEGTWYSKWYYIVLFVVIGVIVIFGVSILVFIITKDKY